jgi:hypothetical protein
MELKYYEKQFQLEDYPNYTFKIKRLPPTEILAKATTFGQMTKTTDWSLKQEVYDFILESMIVCNGTIETEVKFKGRPDIYPKELEDDYNYPMRLISLFIENVFEPVFLGTTSSKR